MSITAQMVKELRIKSSAGMMDCKKALSETNGDMDAAVDWLRKKGLATASKKSGRVASEGLIGICIEDNFGSIVEVNSETDFVARNVEFQEFVSSVAKISLNNKGDLDDILKSKYLDFDKSVKEVLTDKIAKIGEIPCYIRIANDEEMLEMAIVENIQRKNLNAIEIGLSYQRLIDECNLTHEQLSIKLSKNRSTISNFLRLLKLPVEVQKALRDSKITMGHARALLSFNSEAEILTAFNKIISESLSVRDAEKMNQKKKLKKEEKIILSRYELRMQNNISFQLKSDVKIKKNSKGKGQLVISFKNQDQLNEILENFDQ